MTTPSPKPRRKWFLGLLLLLVAAAAGTGAYFQSKREKPVLVQTEKVTRRNLTEIVIANGRIQPVLSVKISPEVSGEIIELPVKEGQAVKKGELLLRIKPDTYQANKRSAEASYQSAVASKNLAEANLEKAEVELRRHEELAGNKLVSESVFLEVKTLCNVARATVRQSGHQVDVARAALARAEEDLAKTIIVAPISGAVTKLTSQLGERVVGTAMMSGTEIMTVADLNEMEARVDIGEIDVVLIALGQKARLEVDAFRDRKFTGLVTEIANSSRSPAQGGQSSGGQQSQEATKFEVKIRVQEKEAFRPGMSVTAEIETRSRTNVLSVPIQSVTTRLPKGTNANTTATNLVATAEAGKSSKPDKAPKPVEIAFLLNGETVKSAPVTRGISDDTYVEITEGLNEGQEVISGGYKAISRDLEDGKRVKVGVEKPKEGEKPQ
jgi:HlyD family secretion protein